MKLFGTARPSVLLGLSLLFTACGLAPSPVPPLITAITDSDSISAQAVTAVPFRRVLDKPGSSVRDLPSDAPQRTGSIRTLALGADIVHDKASPFPFDEPRSTNVVNDSDGPNSNQYNPRSVGIKINVPIRRWVGPTSNGSLLNVNDLIAKGVVSSTFKLRLPTYDVDQDTRPSFDCDGDGINDQLNQEVDDVYWNGEKIGSFQGSNDTWS